MSEDAPFIVVRDDGYSQFGGPDLPTPLTPEKFLELNVDYLAKYPSVKVKEMGVGPGSAFTYDTKVGDLSMSLADENIMKIAREYDRQVYDNVRYLIAGGKDGLQLAAERCHEMGLKLWARFEINHTYGPPAADNYVWQVLMGRFDREHPQYRIGYRPDTCPEGMPAANMDFKHEEVRAFKLEIIRELARHDVDGVSLDFCVYPPFLENPHEDWGCLTRFMRDARGLLDEEGARGGRYIALIARVEYAAEKQGLRWRDWIKEGLLDYVIPSVADLASCWDVPNGEFVEACRGTKCRCLTCVRPFVQGIVDTDPNPQDAKSGLAREHMEPRLSNEAIYAKAYLGLKNGSAGVQVAIGTGGLTDTRKIDYATDNRRDGWREVYGDLADVALLEKSDKLYSFNADQGLPALLSRDQPEARFSLRVADDPGKIARATLIMHARGLTPVEYVDLTINGRALRLTGEQLRLSCEDYPILTRGDAAPYLLYRIPRWWDIGRNEIDLPPDMLREGVNEFAFRYGALEGEKARFSEFRFGRVDLRVEIAR